MLLEIPKRIIIQETLVKTESHWKCLKKNNNSGNPGEYGMLLEVPKKRRLVQETLHGGEGMLLEVPKIIITLETLVKTECN
jgi:hypothetical protein